ncbi:MAG: BON domain-containing protein, partial [Candidatus Eremiobacteraeota bacterium]|nr:BON domain-containing protein [Candidatus Eremiobacteraeota bacterium]
GVLTVSGSAPDQSHKDAIVALLRTVGGVRDVQANWDR